MKIDLPGLLRERMASGRYRYRVRVEGDKATRIPLAVGPEDRQFMEHYRAARAGVKLERAASPVEAATPRTISWLTLLFEEAMQARVKAGLLKANTAKQRAAFYARLRELYGQKSVDMPRKQVVKIRDDMMETPGAADNMVKAIRAMYAWALDQGHVSENPALEIGTINRGKGAIPWTVDDMAKFKEKHPPGTTAHLALTLFMFTACRIDDVVKLGRDHEVMRDGINSLHWQPGKRGSSPVTVPILPPLARAIAAQKVVGATYLLTEHGKPFASGAAFGNKFRKWVADAGLTDRSAHGIRKAAGELMARAGATQYEITAVHGHVSAKTSEIYTKGYDRLRAAASAMSKMGDMDW